MDWLSLEEALEKIANRTGLAFGRKDLYIAVAQDKIKLSFYVFGDLWGLKLFPKMPQQARVMLSYGGFERSYLEPKLFFPDLGIKTAVLDEEIDEKVKAQIFKCLCAAQDSHEDFLILQKMITLLDYRSKLASPYETLNAISGHDENLAELAPFDAELIPDFEGLSVCLSESNQTIFVAEYVDYIRHKIPHGLYHFDLFDGGVKDIFNVINNSGNEYGGRGRTYLTGIDSEFIFRVLDMDLSSPYVNSNGQLSLPNKSIGNVLNYLIEHPGATPCILKSELDYYLDTQPSVASDNLKTKNADKKVKRSESPPEWHESLEEIFKELIDSLGFYPSYKHVKEFIKKLKHKSPDYAFTGEITKNRSATKTDVFHLHGAPPTISQSRVEGMLTELRKKYKKES